MNDLILVHNATKFLNEKINKYGQIKEARRQLAVCKYLLDLVKRDTPSRMIISRSFYKIYYCNCGAKVDESDKFCRECGSRFEKDGWDY